MQTALRTGSMVSSQNKKPETFWHWSTDRLFYLEHKTRARGPGPILESKGMGAIFHKKGKNMLKKGKIFDNLAENWRKCTKFENYFKKGSLLRTLLGLIDE